MTNQTPTAMRRHWHGKIKPLLEDDAISEPTYKSLVAAVAAVWMTVILIGAAAWLQFSSTTSGPDRTGTTNPASTEAAGVRGEGL